MQQGKAYSHPRSEQEANKADKLISWIYPIHS